MRQSPAEASHSADRLPKRLLAHSVEPSEVLNPALLARRLPAQSLQSSASTGSVSPEAALRNPALPALPCPARP